MHIEQQEIHEGLIVQIGVYFAPRIYDGETIIAFFYDSEMEAAESGGQYWGMQWESFVNPSARKSYAKEMAHKYKVLAWKLVSSLDTTVSLHTP